MPETVSQLVARDVMSSNFVQVDVSQPVSQALAALKKGEASEAVVMNGKKFSGLLSETGLLRNVDLTKTKVSNVMRTSPSAAPTDSFDKMVRIMRDSDVRVLPVLEKGKLVGVVTIQEIISRLQSNEKWTGATAKSLATFNPITINASSDLGKAIQQMRGARIRKLPVVNDQKKPVGVLLIEDVVTDVLMNLDRDPRSAYKIGRGSQSLGRKPALSLSVKSVMDENIPLVSGNEKGKKVVQLLSNQRNPVVMVADNGLSGIISAQSILDAYLKSPVAETAALTSPVQVSHLPNLDEVDKAFVDTLLNRTYGKVERILKGEHTMHAVFKQTQKSGLRAKTEVKLTVQGAGKTFNASASEWKVRLAVKEACNAIEHEVEKTYKSGQDRKNRA